MNYEAIRAQIERYPETPYDRRAIETARSTNQITAEQARELLALIDHNTRVLAETAEASASPPKPESIALLGQLKRFRDSVNEERRRLHEDKSRKQNNIHEKIGVPQTLRPLQDSPLIWPAMEKPPSPSRILDLYPFSNESRPEQMDRYILERSVAEILSKEKKFIKALKNRDAAKAYVKSGALHLNIIGTKKKDNSIFVELSDPTEEGLLVSHIPTVKTARNFVYYERAINGAFSHFCEASKELYRSLQEESGEAGIAGYFSFSNSAVEDLRELERLEPLVIRGRNTYRAEEESEEVVWGGCVTEKRDYHHSKVFGIFSYIANWLPERRTLRQTVGDLGRYRAERNGLRDRFMRSTLGSGDVMNKTRGAIVRVRKKSSKNIELWLALPAEGTDIGDYVADGIRTFERALINWWVPNPDAPFLVEDVYVTLDALYYAFANILNMKVK